MILLSHLVVQNCVTDAAVVETRLAAADGSTYDTYVVFFDPSSRARVILEFLNRHNRVRQPSPPSPTSLSGAL